MLGLVFCLAVSRRKERKRCKLRGGDFHCVNHAPIHNFFTINSCNEDVNVLAVGHICWFPKAYFDPLLQRIGGKTGAEANLCGEMLGYI